VRSGNADPVGATPLDITLQILYHLAIVVPFFSRRLAGREVIARKIVHFRGELIHEEHHVHDAGDCLRIHLHYIHPFIPATPQQFQPRLFHLAKLDPTRVPRI